VCEALSETLTPTDEPNFKHDIQSLISFLTFDSRFPADQLFWVSYDTNQCQAIDSRGVVFTISDCDRVLPGFCSQSSPFNLDSSQVSEEIAVFYSLDNQISGS
jgi:hypothetical protein